MRKIGERPPNPYKRLRTVPSVSSSSTGQIENPNPNSFPNVPDFNHNHVDLVISSFLSLPDLPSLSSPLSIGCSFDRALEKQLFKASGDDSVQDRLTDRSLQLATLLQESTKRCYRKRVTLCNFNSWPLPHELTVKVFIMGLFRSLKLGLVPFPDESTTSLLTGTCLAPLSFKHGLLVRVSFTNVTQFARNYPNITSLSLIGFKLQDSEASLLIESFGKLKYLDLSRTFEFDGSFLRNVELRCRDTLMETLILRGCITLEDRPVLQFWDSLLEGNFRFIQHVDISNFAGLIVGGGSRKYCTPKFCLDKLKEKRHGLTFVANFTLA